jgi:Zn-dependent protease with chaperone function
MESELSESLLAPEAATARADPSPWQGLECGLEPPRIPFRYRFSLVVVSLAMVLLPVVYAALVGFFLYGAAFYAVRTFSTLVGKQFGPVGFLIEGINFLGILGIGLVMTFFFVKPIFAPKAEVDEPFSLNHADAPRLFALVGWICRALNAPIPSRIDVNLSPNAGAGFRSGWRSIFGNDIALVIGLPLVAGLDLGQFAGVIAHEYGHFSQGTAMRASYLIRQINAWFFRVVYLRDRWDYLLVWASEDGRAGLLVMPMAYLARFGVWLGRRILWVLMLVGQALSCLLERQMEFDADGYELKLSGTESFIATSRRLRQLNLGMTVAQQQLLAKWRTDRKLFDQLPDYIVSCANEVSAEVQQRHLAQTLNRQTRLFDTHPSDAERIQRARAANEPGLFHASAPATTLFTNFPELARRLTVAHYQQLIGPEFSGAWLVSTEQTVRQAGHDHTADKEAVRRYFLGLTTSLRPIIVTENKSRVFRSREVLMAEIRALRQRMTELAPALLPAYEAFRDADEQMLRTIQAGELLRAGFAFNPADFGLADADVAAALSAARETFEAAGGKLKEFEEAGRTRLTDAIQLLRLPDFGATIPQAAQFQETSREMIYALARLGEVFAPLLEVRRECAALEIILRYRERGERGDHLTASLDRLTTQLRGRIELIQQTTAQIRYPFHHTTERIFVSEYARNKEYHPDPYELVLREGRSHTHKLIALYYRLLGSLVLIAEEVERTMVGG